MWQWEVTTKEQAEAVAFQVPNSVPFTVIPEYAKSTKNSGME